ncbi:MAG: glycerol-3-phosphate dehydrogenase/oxidase [Parvibaculaceae bacterium]|nr:glycerol-3-phosphate dehydrogenase/oxidase [Parvibaculaceae bacterium]
MKRDLPHMAQETFDLVIIGGGISGASIAWDATLRGLKVALLEKDDFAHATTAGSSKLIHGGLRYLVNGELGLVRESLKERRIWETIAPHMVDPLPFLIPTYGKGMQSGLVLSVGLTFYDLLSFDRNWLNDDDKKLPGYKSLSRQEALDIMPSLKKEGLTGAKIYYDCQMFAPERLCLEFILGATDKGAQAANYAKVTDFIRHDDIVEGVVVEDRLTGKSHNIRARLVINASGPWADKVMGLADDTPSRGLIRSKGIHIITRELSGKTALAIQSAIGGHFFVIPWRGHTIFGTTDSVFKGNPDALGVSETDITSFLEVVNDGLPGLNLTREDVVHQYAGLRPLVDTNPNDGEETESYNVSRAAEVADHAKLDGIEGFISALGGKWTTSRHLAEQVVAMAFEKLGRDAPASTTATTPLYGGGVEIFREFLQNAQQRHPEMEPAIIENLARFHGARLEDVLAQGDGAPSSLLEPLSETRKDIGAQVLHCVRNEMAITLSDMLFRRSGIATLGHPGTELLQKAADLMAEELDWDNAERAIQIEAVERRLETIAD